LFILLEVVGVGPMIDECKNCAACLSYLQFAPFAGASIPPPKKKQPLSKIPRAAGFPSPP